MPIHCPVTIPCLDADAFEKLDYRVMGHAYASQNELGRFCDECAYEADLKARLLSDGFRSVHTQVPVTVTHREFSLNRNELALGAQRMLVHAPGVAFRLTALTKAANSVEPHFHRLLALTDLQAIQWINLNHAQVEFTTITR